MNKSVLFEGIKEQREKKNPGKTDINVHQAPPRWLTRPRRGRGAVCHWRGGGHRLRARKQGCEGGSFIVFPLSPGRGREPAPPTAHGAARVWGWAWGGTPPPPGRTRWQALGIGLSAGAQGMEPRGGGSHTGPPPPGWRGLWAGGPV